MTGLDERLSGKVALVTEAGGGIGRATVARLAAEGAAVVAGDLKGYSAVADAVRAAGGRALGVELDVTSSESARAAVEAAIAHFGGLHILVNNAGIDHRGQLEELSEADWDRLLTVNLKGPFLCSLAAARYLPAGGAIVNVASLAGRSSSPLQGCHYSASKAGLLGLTRHPARELGPRHIRVNAVCPGSVVTDMLTRSTSSEGIAALAAQVPVGRAGTPADIPSVIAFLASEDAGYINGASLDANGGVQAAFGEELGWRGYALPGLQSRIGALPASLVIGVIWAAWHLPFYADPSVHLLPFWTDFGLFTVTLVSQSVLATWIYNGTGRSVLATILYHHSIHMASLVQ